jgi:hypothetical protein
MQRVLGYDVWGATFYVGLDSATTGSVEGFTGVTLQRIAAVLACTLVAGCAPAQQRQASYVPPPSPAQIDATKCPSDGTIGFWFTCGLLVLGSAAEAQAAPVFGLAPDAALLRAAAQTPIPAELMKEVDALRRRLIQLWSLPTIAKDAQESTIDISMKLKRDGTLDGPPEVLRAVTVPGSRPPATAR